jgi:hypothetical protein
MLHKLGLLIFLLTAISAKADESALQSPYFIDGLHCSGLAQHEGPEYLLLPREESESAKLIEAEEDCADLFKTFGIEPYIWLSPVELERLSAQISQAPYFESASLSVKKSDLKNHVHVFLKVKTKSKYVYNFSFQSKLYSFDNPRLFTRISGDLMDRSLLPNSNDAWGFFLDTGLAAQALFAANPLAVPGNSDQIYNRNFYFIDLHYNHQRRLHQNLTLSLAGRLNIENILAGRDFDFSGSIDADLTYSKYFRFLHGSLFGGLAVIVTPDLGYLVSLYSTSNTGNYDTPIVLPGFKVGYLFGRTEGTYFRTEFSGYRAFYGNKSLLEWKSILNLDLGAGYAVHAGLHWKQTRDLILVRDKSPSTDASNNTASIGIGKTFEKAGERSELILSGGVEKLNYTLQPYSPGVTPFVKAGYRIQGDTLNLDLSLTYLGTRIY